MGLAVAARRRLAPQRPLLLTLFLSLAVGILALAFLTESHARAGLLKEKGGELSAIVGLKVAGIAAWRAERIGDARSLSEDPFLVRAVSLWLAAGAPAEGDATLRARLASVRDAYDYERISLLDARGEAKLTEPATSLSHGEAIQWEREGLPNAEIVFLDLRRSDAGGGIHLDLIAPLRPAGSPAAPPVAFLVFRIDPGRFLYPLVQSWPMPSRSAETLLVRREGNEVVYLNELRHRTGTALTLRFPLTQPGLPAALAARGHEGVADGVDYRGERVLAATHSVPISPWFLVSKIDRAELLAPLARERWLVALLALALVSLSGVGVQRVWRREREASDAQLRESEERYRALAETSPDDIFIIDAAGRVAYFNARAAARFGGLDPADIEGRALRELFPPDLGVAMEASVRQAASTGQPVYHEREVRFSGGSVWLGVWLAPLGGDAFAGAVMGVARDITERKVAEDSLERERRLLNELITTIPDNIYFKDRSSRFIKINDALARWLGLSDPKDAVGRTDRDFFAEEHAQQAYADEQRVMATGQPQLGVEEKETWPDGTVTWVSTSKVPIRDAAGQIVGIVGISRDITERKRAEEELRESARALLESQRVARLGSYRTYVLAGTWESSAILDEIFGIADRAFRRDVAGWLSIVHPDQREEMAAYFAEEVLGKRKAFDREYRISRVSDGRERWVHGLGELVADREGRIVEMVGTIQDITDRKLAEERQAKAEEQLRQSQKLEAIGRLAGGVAHDFNNLLGVIMGYGEMVHRRLAGEDPLKGKVEQILKAAERAAALTRQLLAFGRKQVLQPKILDLNAVVSDMDKMLRRLIGEDVELAALLDPHLGTVRADPGQVEQVIMNLAVNARDAMPEGGRITVETRNADLDAEFAAAHEPTRPGSYVMLAFTDTGSGMDAATQARIFEPFFTTKEVGKGTGLGLSTVYGIVKQSEGYVWVYSEVGVGTTFKIYLPRVDEIAREARADGPRPLRRGSETVLLVEDEASLRDLLRETLEANGYLVLVARDGAEAVQIAEDHPGPIPIMVTDVVMPGLTGPEVANLIAQARPKMKVLYISGYSEESIVRHGLTGPGRALLNKPFTPEALLRRVRDSLDAV